jgi:hypothetical protein
VRENARRIVIGVLAAALIGAGAAVIIIRAARATVTLTGVVLRQDADPRKQLPIAGVRITATENERSASTESDTSGLFHLKLTNGGWRDQPVTLMLQHSGYRPFAITYAMKGELYILRLTPAAEQNGVPAGSHEIAIKEVRVRYSEKASNVVNVGSAARTFTVPNIGNVPCDRVPACSPDGKWKAAEGGITMDAGEGQQFDNARVACIAGPCPFTEIETGAVPRPGRIITVKVLNWSDTATFLVEAEVRRIMPTDAIRQAYPAIYGRSMSFTLPATAEGPSIQADFAGMEIVFPLGPLLKLSWAECTLQMGADQTKLYRCELKPGYEFR